MDCIKCQGLSAQLEIALKLNDYYAADVRRLQSVAQEDNEAIGAYRYSLESALQKIEKADRLLNKANADITMLQARIEHGSGADPHVLCDLAFIVLYAREKGLIKVTDEHIKHLRIAAKGVK